MELLKEVIGVSLSKEEALVLAKDLAHLEECSELAKNLMQEMGVFKVEKPVEETEESQPELGTL